MLPLLPFERIAKKSGVKRISREALEEARDIISEHAHELCIASISVSNHAKRRTVKEEDVVFVSQSRK